MRTGFRLSACFLLLGLLPVLFSAWTSQIQAHEGEQHSTVAPTPVGQKSYSISGAGETYELTIAYPPFKPGQVVPLRLFLANLETNQPIVNDELSLPLIGPRLEQTIKPTTTDRPGEYRAETKVNSDASHSFLVEVSTKASSDLFSIDEFKMPNPPPSAPVTAEQSVPEWRDYFWYMTIGIAIVVALVFYWLGRREHARLTDKAPPGTRTDAREETS
jgi:hypothetical protein